MSHYDTAIEQIARDGKPWAITLDKLSNESRAQLFSEYYSHDARRWNTVRAEYEVGHKARCKAAGINPVHCTTAG
jgi:hypothetical protein